MKIAARAADGFVLAPGASCVLLYGPDQGLVAERSRALRAAVLGDSADAFRYADPAAAAISADPALLVDEAAALSLTGGRRVVRVAAAGDALAAAFADLLRRREGSDPDGESLVIAEGGDLGSRSALRKLFETSAAGAAVPCYADDPGQIRAFAEELLRGMGHRVEPAASDWIARTIGGDRALLRGELEKLSLFAGAGAAITLAEAETCLGDSARIDLDTAALAAVSGDRAALDRILGRCFVAGQSPVSVLRVLGRTVERLHLAAGMVAQGKSPDAALKALKPPVFWKHLPQYQRALGTWSVARLGTALAMIVDAEADCKRTGAPDQAVAWRTALRIAQAGRGSGNHR